MRRTTLGLALVVAAIGAFGTAAGTAAADVPNPTITNLGFTADGYHGYRCQTGYMVGSLGQYGAWGDFTDGCTIKIWCGNQLMIYGGACDVRTTTWIDTRYSLGHHVTQNARLRKLDYPSQTPLAWSDKSCSGVNSCSTSDYMSVPIGLYASVQCNGVREPTIIPGANSARNTCDIWYRWHG